MQNLPYSDPLFINIETIKYFQRKEKVLCIGALLGQISKHLIKSCLPLPLLYFSSRELCIALFHQH